MFVCLDVTRSYILMHSSCTAMNGFSFAKCKLCVTNCVMFVEKKIVLEINKRGRKRKPMGKNSLLSNKLVFLKVGM